MSKALVKAIGECGMTHYRLAKESGVSAGALSRFVRGKRMLSLEAVDALADVLGFELVKGRNAGRGPKP